MIVRKKKQRTRQNKKLKKNSKKYMDDIQALIDHTEKRFMDR